jgi:hypothetical protein
MGFQNSYGEFNWCVQNASSADICFPGCSVDSTVCSHYPGTTCQSVTDVTGYATKICAAP